MENGAICRTCGNVRIILCKAKSSCEEVMAEILKSIFLYVDE